MNDKQKSIWKKSWTGWSWLPAWLILMAAVFLIFLIIVQFIPGGPRHFLDLLPAPGINSLVIATVAVGLWALTRWLLGGRHFKRFLFRLACFATLIALVYTEEDWRGGHAWQKFKQEWEAKGEKFDMASVTPPPVPEDQNFALTPIVASSYEAMLDKAGHEIRPRNTNVVDRLSMITWRDNHWAKIPESDGWQASKKSDLKAWQAYFRSPPPTNSVETNSFPVAPRPQSPADDILLALSKYDSAIEEIRQAGQLPYSRFPLTYNKENPADIMLPHLAALKSCAQALNLRSLAEQQNGQSEKALADVKLSLRVADSIHTEPFLISHLVRIAILQNALQPVWEGLAEHRWSEEQLVALDMELAKLDFLADYKLGMRGESGLQGGIIECLRQHPEQMMDISHDNYNGHKMPFPARIIWQMIPSSWFDQSRLRCARMMVEFYIPLADMNQRTISPALTRRANAAFEADIKHRSLYNILERMLLPALGNAVEKFARAQTSADSARTAIALERYRLAHGEYPESLDVLAPQFIAKLPHDVINGQPPHYRQTSDGQFVLYSVGWNETDDGGEVGLTKNGNVDINTGDWVWRYPAK